MSDKLVTVGDLKKTLEQFTDDKIVHFRRHENDCLQPIYDIYIGPEIECIKWAYKDES